MLKKCFSNSFFSNPFFLISLGKRTGYFFAKEVRKKVKEVRKKAKEVRKKVKEVGKRLEKKIS